MLRCPANSFVAYLRPLSSSPDYIQGVPPGNCVSCFEYEYCALFNLEFNSQTHSRAHLPGRDPQRPAKQGPWVPFHGERLPGILGSAGPTTIHEVATAAAAAVHGADAECSGSWHQLAQPQALHHVVLTGRWHVLALASHSKEASFVSRSHGLQ